MSQWTHVVGVIRFDGIPGMPFPELGTPVGYGKNTEKEWDECTVPCGSEGSLHISDWRESSPNAMARQTVSIFGDLRDYDDEEIIAYFKRITADYLIRQACFTIDVEYQRKRHFVWMDDEEKDIQGFVEVTKAYQLGV